MGGEGERGKGKKMEGGEGEGKEEGNWWLGRERGKRKEMEEKGVEENKMVDKTPKLPVPL